jgi:hypothetical protein
MARVAPSERFRAELDEALAGVGQEQDPVETVGRLGARLILQQALEDEVTEFLGRARYERAEETVSHRNGYGELRFGIAGVPPPPAAYTGSSTSGSWSAQRLGGSWRRRSIWPLRWHTGQRFSAALAAYRAFYCGSSANASRRSAERSSRFVPSPMALLDVGPECGEEAHVEEVAPGEPSRRAVLADRSSAILPTTPSPHWLASCWARMSRPIGQ